MQLTVFGDITASTQTQRDITWEKLVARFETPQTYPDKVSCPLISLSVFGDKRTDRGSLRSAENVTGCWGVELDYDGEKMSVKEAGERLGAAGIRHLIYTSASYSKDAPRWRAIVPFDKLEPPEARLEAAEKCNGVLGGVLTSETFALSQPFYAGKVKGVEYGVSVRGGGDVLALDLPRIGWRGADRSAGGTFVETSVFVDMILSGEEVHPAIAALAWRGWGREELEDLMQRSPLRETRPARWEQAIRSDIPRAVESASRKRLADLERRVQAMPPPPEPAKPLPRLARLANVSDMVSEPEAVSWLIDGLIEHQSLAMLFGEPGSGKSYLALAWALAVAHGEEWAGRKTRGGLVVYIAGEGFTGIRRRVKAWEVRRGRGIERGARMWVSKRSVPMTSPDDLAALYADIEGLGEDPGLIVVDTVSRATPGLDQNSAKEIGEFVRLCDALKERYCCSVLLIHHSGQGNLTRGKGAIDLKASLDVECALLKVDGSPGVVVLKSTKAKDTDEFSDIYLTFETVTLPWLEDPQNPLSKPQTSSVMVVCDKPATGGKPEPNALLLVREIVRSKGMAKVAARDEYKRLYVGKPDSAVRTFHRAVAQGIASGVLAYDEDMDVLSEAFGVPDS